MHRALDLAPAPHVTCRPPAVTCNCQLLLQLIFAAHLCPPYSVTLGQCREGAIADCCQQGQCQP
jgi:hypothetical protein